MVLSSGGSIEQYFLFYRYSISFHFRAYSDEKERKLYIQPDLKKIVDVKRHVNSFVQGEKSG